MPPSRGREALGVSAAAVTLEAVIRDPRAARRLPATRASSRGFRRQSYGAAAFRGGAARNAATERGLGTGEGAAARDSL